VYHTVGQNACSSCHQTHNAIGSARLLRGVNEQDCMQCHGGGSNISPGIPNVFAEFGKVGHPFPSGTNLHDAAETTLLNQNRHSTCADCHNSHASQPTGTFTVPPLLRPSQNNVAGISANDGFTVLNPSVNQFENCLRCHGYSTGKVVNPIYGYLPVWVVSAGDPLNVIPQFALTSTSSHPVTHVSNSVLPQPSLRQYMLNLDGITPGRGMGVQIFCSDCHNADDNREFGGTGPNGPHGSKWTHILERRYEFSQAVSPGGTVTNLFPNPDLSVNGPLRLMWKMPRSVAGSHQQQLLAAFPAHQLRLLLLCLPYIARYGQHFGEHLRRANGELRCECGGGESGYADPVHALRQLMYPDLPYLCAHGDVAGYDYHSPTEQARS
jgi:predicted CXXCH cytochrome family protein